MMNRDFTTISATYNITKLRHESILLLCGFLGLTRVYFMRSFMQGFAEDSTHIRKEIKKTVHEIKENYIENKLAVRRQCKTPMYTVLGSLQ